MQITDTMKCALDFQRHIQCLAGGEGVRVKPHAAVVGLGSHCSTWARFLQGSGGRSWTCSAPSWGHLTPAQNPLPHQPRSGNSQELLEPMVMALKVAPGLSPGPGNGRTLFGFSLFSHGAVAVEVSIRRNSWSSWSGRSLF